MSQLSQYIVHDVALTAPATEVRFATLEDYRVVSGLDQAGHFIHPQADAAYLVACGVLGLAYTSTLGRGGAAIIYRFASPVVSVQVATTSNLAPVISVVLPSRIIQIQEMARNVYNQRVGAVDWPAHPADEVLAPRWYHYDDGTAECNPFILLGKTVAEIRALGWESADPFGDQS